MRAERGYLMIGLAIALAVLTVISLGLWNRLNAAHAETAKIRGIHTAFVENTRIEGERAEARANNEIVRQAGLLKSMENENAKLKLDLVASVKRVRDATDASARSRQLPPAPATSSRPDLLCLDRAQYQLENRAIIAELFEGIRRLADEGSANTLNLKTSVDWAAKALRPIP